MTVTFLSEERSNAAKRSSRRRRPFATPVMLAGLGRFARPKNHQHPVMAAHLDRGDRGWRAQQTEGWMSTADTTTEAFADTRPGDAADLPDYAPIPKSALGPALNEQGYDVERVERNLYAVTDGTYQLAFLTTSDGVVLLDARRPSATTSGGPSTKSPRPTASAAR